VTQIPQESSIAS